MGRKTYETIGKPLRGRHNIVMTRARDYEAPGCTVVHSAEAALAAAGDAPEVMIIGGAQIYRHFLAQAERLYLTQIEASFEGDALFPQIAQDQWRTVWEERHGREEGHPYSFRYVIMKRTRGA
jgi:dihydrofolate reductase